MRSNKGNGAVAHVGITSVHWIFGDPAVLIEEMDYLDKKGIGPDELDSESVDNRRKHSRTAYRASRSIESCSVARNQH